MKKLYASLLLLFGTTLGAVAQTNGYQPIDIAQFTATSKTDATKDVVIRNGANNAYFVKAGNNNLVVTNTAAATRDKFRLIRTGTNTAHYKIYSVSKSKFVKWTARANNSSITAYTDNENDNNTTWLIVNNNNAATNDGAYDIIPANASTNYVGTDPCWNPHGGMQNDRAIGGWTATDGNSVWQICVEGANTSLTYALKFNGQEVGRHTFNTVVGAPYPAIPAHRTPYGVTFTYPTGKVATAGTESHDVVVTENASVTYPMVMQSAYNATQNWYTMRVKNLSVKRDNDYFSLQASAELNDPFQFQFVGNRFGFKIYNKQIGNTRALGIPSKADNQRYTTNASIASTESEFILVEHNGKFLLLEKGTDNLYVNCRTTDNVQYMSTWNHKQAYDINDLGSLIEFTKASERDFYTQKLTEYRNKAKANTERFDRLPIFATNDYNTMRTALDATQTVENEAAYNSAVAAINSALTTFFSTAANTNFVLKNKQHGRYMNVVNNKLKGTHYAAENSAQFKIAHAELGRVTLINVATGKKGQAVTAFSTNVPVGDTGEKYTLSVNNEGFAFFRQETTFAGGANYEYLHESNAHDIVLWEAAANASMWTMEIADPANYLSDARTKLTAAVAGKTPGTQLGQKRFSSVVITGQNTSATLDQVIAALDAMKIGTGWELVKPAGDKFFRIKTVKSSAKYVSATPASDNRLSLSTTADASTLFYCTADGKLISVGNGKAVSKPGNQFGAPNYTDGVAMTFGDAISAESNDKYIISSGGRYLSADGNAASASVDAGNSVDQNNTAFRFILEEVTSIPVSIGATGYATFFTPVAVSLPTGYEAYVVRSMTSNSATLAQVSGVIPANTAFIIKGTASTECNLTVSTATPATIGTNLLTGAAVTPAAVQAADNVYALRASSTNNAVFGKLGDGKYPRAFRAFLRNSSGGGVQELTIDITALDLSPLAPSADAPLYDLSGRRVEKARPGSIYIRNGKKFISF